jgi:hypothetical protein
MASPNKAEAIWPEHYRRHKADGVNDWLGRRLYSPCWLQRVFWCGPVFGRTAETFRHLVYESEMAE